MKKLLALILLAGIAPKTYSQLIIKENFDKYTIGQPVENKTVAGGYSWEKYNTNQGDWIVSSDEKNSAGISPAIVSYKLSYPGYGEVEKAMELNAVNQKTGSESRITTFRFQDKGVTIGDTVYVAFLVNFSDMPNRRGATEFFNTYRVTQSYVNPKATGSCTSRGRIYAATDGQGNVAISFSKANDPVKSSIKFPKTSTALLVLKWKHNSNVSKGPNDFFHLYVNPDVSKTEQGNSANLTVAGDNEETEGGGDLRQLAFLQNSGKVAAKIGAIRVGKTFESIVKK